MTTQVYHGSDRCNFSEETLLLIAYYEDMFKCEQVKVSKSSIYDKLKWANELIFYYDTSETDYNREIREKNRHKDYNLVCKALNKGKLDKEIKFYIKPTKYKDEKRCNVKKIARTIHLLKIAQGLGKKAFEKFILIPDVNYILTIIEKDTFGDLKYLFSTVA